MHVMDLIKKILLGKPKYTLVVCGSEEGRRMLLAPGVIQIMRNAEIRDWYDLCAGAMVYTASVDGISTSYRTTPNDAFEELWEMIMLKYMNKHFGNGQ